MAKKVKTSLDFEKNEIQNVVVQKLAASPASPVSGQIYYDTVQNAFFYYNGTAWVKCVETPTVRNVGSGAGVYKQVLDNWLEFRKIKGASGITVTEYASDIEIKFSGAEVSHASLLDVGTNSHAQIDSHIASTANPHGVTKTQVGLGSVDNLQQLPMSYLDADGALAANSDVKVASQKAVKTYVDNKVTGVSWKDSVRVATTANITLSGTQTIDGVAVVAGDRVLVKNQTTASANGIYIVAAGAWSRAADNDTAAEMLNATVMVQEGTTNADTQWTCSTNAPITLNTTALTFSQMSGAGTYAAGNGINITGNSIAISTAVVVTKTDTQTLTNKTLTTPVIEQWIYDSNGVKILLVTPTAGAVNQLEVTNAITANAPKLKAAGTDTNIDIDIVPKGTGRVKANNVVVPTISSTDTLSNKTIDVASNTISNIDAGNFKSGLLDTDDTLSANSDIKIATQKAVKRHVATQVATKTAYYKGTITAAATGTITGATHACGTAPHVQVYEVSGGNAYLVEVDVAVATASGDVTWTAGAAFTGYIVIIGK